MTAPRAATPVATSILTREFVAMGTDWYVEASGVTESVLERIADLVERDEQRFSRFRASSALSRLNAERVSNDAELARCLRAAEVFRRDTAGAFDAGIGAAMVAAGYERDFAELSQWCASTRSRAQPSERLRIWCDGRRVGLHGQGQIDLGGVAKGWTVDRAGRCLESAGAMNWLIDAGGDIAVGGAVALERPIAVGLTGLTLGLSRGAVATSSTLKRAWNTTDGRKHHIIDPRRGVPTSQAFVQATVRAPGASTADALATAMLVDPAATTAALPKHRAEAILVGRGGEVFMSPGMAAHLR